MVSSLLLHYDSHWLVMAPAERCEGGDLGWGWVAWVSARVYALLVKLLGSMCVSEVTQQIPAPDCVISCCISKSGINYTQTERFGAFISTNLAQDFHHWDNAAASAIVTVASGIKKLKFYEQTGMTHNCSLSLTTWPQNTSWSGANKAINLSVGWTRGNVLFQCWLSYLRDSHRKLWNIQTGIEGTNETNATVRCLHRPQLLPTQFP